MLSENFKQLFLGHLEIHFGWELHSIHHHLSSQNLYFDFHSIRNDLLPHFGKLTLSRTPTRCGYLEAPKGRPIRKYSGECFAPSFEWYSQDSKLKLVALTLCVWVGVLSTLLPKCSAAELNFLWICMFLMCRIHLDAIFHSECTFSIFLMCHLKISKNLF